jgi:hypothetical protein
VWTFKDVYEYNISTVQNRKVDIFFISVTQLMHKWNRDLAKIRLLQGEVRHLQQANSQLVNACIWIPL